MRILIAPDKFKGCLDADDVAAAIADGVRDAAPDTRIDLCPMADGGEGTVRALVAATGGTLVKQLVTGPLPEMKVEAEFGILGDGQTAVIEMAAASGLALLKLEDRGPMNTTTFGTGELLFAAAKRGVKTILLGIGGSATNDGGVGCAQAAGLTVLLEGGEPVSMTEPLCGRDIDRVILVKRGRGSPVDHCRIVVACDVTNPLYGENGAARIFGPQKGATREQVMWLDENLRALASRTGKDDHARTPGAGAAGGLGFGMLAFFGAELKPGVKIVTDAVGLRERLRGVDLCITGEGKLDRQSLAGKTPVGVARLCREMTVPCIALAGAVEVDQPEMAKEGIDAAFAIGDKPMELEESMNRAREMLRRSAANAVALFIRGARRP